VLLELQQLLPVEEAEVEDLDHDSANGCRVLSPGTRMIDRAGVLHFYDGRRLVSYPINRSVVRSQRSLRWRTLEPISPN
jgi:hypothetical protein